MLRGVTGDAPPHGGIDWTTASVEDSTLTVEIAGEPGRKWGSRLQEIIERLDRPGSPWGTVKVAKRTLRVEDVAPGGEADLRHLVESAVLQANAEFAPDEEDEDDGAERSAEDREMTERFRSFSAEPDGEDEGEDAPSDDDD